jgi:hypothetical protein
VLGVKLDIAIVGLLLITRCLLPVISLLSLVTLSQVLSESILILLKVPVVAPDGLVDVIANCIDLFVLLLESWNATLTSPVTTWSIVTLKSELSPKCKTVLLNISQANVLPPIVKLEDLTASAKLTGIITALNVA